MYMSTGKTQSELTEGGYLSAFDCLNEHLVLYRDTNLVAGYVLFSIVFGLAISSHLKSRLRKTGFFSIIEVHSHPLAVPQKINMEAFEFHFQCSISIRVNQCQTFHISNPKQTSDITINI